MWISPRLTRQPAPPRHSASARSASTSGTAALITATPSIWLARPIEPFEFSAAPDPVSRRPVSTWRYRKSCAGLQPLALHTSRATTHLRARRPFPSLALFGRRSKNDHHGVATFTDECPAVGHHPPLTVPAEPRLAIDFPIYGRSMVSSQCEGPSTAPPAKDEWETGGAPDRSTTLATRLSRRAVARFRGEGRCRRAVSRTPPSLRTYRDPGMKREAHRLTYCNRVRLWVRAHTDYSAAGYDYCCMCSAAAGSRILSQQSL